MVALVASGKYKPPAKPCSQFYTSCLLCASSPVQPTMLRKWKELVRKLKEDIYTLYLASKDPRMPFAAKVMVLVTVAYAFSPIDLIPDFIPLIGYLDDLLLLPLGIWLSIKLIPPPLLDYHRHKAREQMHERQPNYVMAGVIVILWLLVGYWMYQAYQERLN